MLIVVWEKFKAGKGGYCILKAQTIRTHYSLGLLGAPGALGVLERKGTVACELLVRGIHLEREENRCHKQKSPESNLCAEN